MREELAKLLFYLVGEANDSSTDDWGTWEQFIQTPDMEPDWYRNKADSIKEFFIKTGYRRIPELKVIDKVELYYKTALQFGKKAQIDIDRVLQAQLDSILQQIEDYNK